MSDQAVDQLWSKPTVKSLANFAASSDSLPQALSVFDQQIRATRTLNDVLLSRALYAPLCVAAVASGTLNAEAYVTQRHGEQTGARYRRLVLGAADKSFLKGQKVDYPATFFASILAAYQEPGAPPSSADSYFAMPSDPSRDFVHQQAATAIAKVCAAVEAPATPDDASTAERLRHFFEDLFVEEDQVRFESHVRQHGKARRLDGVVDGEQTKLESDELAPEGMPEWEAFCHPAWTLRCRPKMEAASVASSATLPLATREQLDDFWEAADHPTILSIKPATVAAAAPRPFSLKMPPRGQPPVAVRQTSPLQRHSDPWGTKPSSRLDFLKDSDDDISLPAGPPPPLAADPTNGTAPNDIVVEPGGGRFIIDRATGKLVLIPKRRPAAPPAPTKPTATTAPEVVAATKEECSDDDVTTDGVEPEAKKRGRKRKERPLALEQHEAVPQPRPPSEPPTTAPSEPTTTAPPTPTSGRTTPGAPLDVPRALASFPPHVRMAAFIGLRAKGLVG